MSPLASQLPVRSGSTTVRHFRETDVDAFHAYRSDPELARYQGWSPLSRDQARAFVVRMSRVRRLVAGDWIQIAIAHAPTDHLIGDLGIFLSEDFTRAEIGFTLCASGQGRGHATRAVSAVRDLLLLVHGCTGVRGITDARNTASIGVLERSGFVHIASQKSRHKDEPCTEFVYETPRHDA